MKATEQNARKLKSVLNDYECLSGQRINLSKSEIVFSRNVPAFEKQAIVEIFNVQEVVTHTKYLGLPIVFSHNKIEVFKFIVDSTWRKVLSWKELQLSAAGKEVLLKSVLQALPTYAMMCYKLPDSVCKRLAGIIRKFWWTNGGENRGIHWANQQKLSMPKSDGGLAFRDLAVFNDALLAKQFWRILENPDTMLGKILKAKYFRDSDLLSSSLKVNSSMAWRGIWRAGMKVRGWIEVDESNRPVWALEQNGVYSTKSAYMNLKEEHKLKEKSFQGEMSDNSKIKNFGTKFGG
ncbi:hypothetical protein QQ045_022708 [Rhodiola kirilowii]